MPKAEPWRYEKLTWSEINQAVAARKVVVVPIGSTEQHGPHLPLDVDVVCPTGVAHATARLIPDEVLVMPSIVHGYTAHVMDFPGTINIHWETFIKMVLDVGKSLAYHGFKKIILLNGHGSNVPNLDLAARRVNLETDAECGASSWWMMLSVDKNFMPSWRESKFPGGCAHACELETSVYLYFDEDNVRKDKIEDGEIAFHVTQRSDFQWVDLFSAGPGTPVSWTASYSDSGVLGQSTLASKEKGGRAVKEASTQLARMIREFRTNPKPPRSDHHLAKPTMPFPWGQDEEPTKLGNVHGEPDK
ncbi:MAG: creatininase family protein [Acidobacteria bacterium]|nr:creatininase family protein [Acidobacteriota bacterium]